ncbi:hypothetical protein ACIBH1_19975 [Nonomuraea sp. NPDC050663]|uniref:hypothetical protein n=1 Tax=Nonomuraea sp. NPDC050663 TaxID=3364370 RepID=UPI00379C2B2F
MDIISEWAVDIARTVAPHEIDFAAEVGAAYAAGGTRRGELFGSARPGEPGGFGGGGAGQLPIILDGVRASADYLYPLLSSGLLGNALAVYALIQAKRNKQPIPPELPAEADRLMDQAISSLIRRGESYGMKGQEAEAWAFLTLETAVPPGSPDEVVRARLAGMIDTEPALPLPRCSGTVSRSWMLPPWIWYYLAAFLLIGVAGYTREWIRQADDYRRLIVEGPGEDRTAAILLIVGSVANLFPVVLFMAAVASLLLPRWHCSRAERTHALFRSDKPVIKDIERFVAGHEPGLVITSSDHGGRLARVYPGGWGEVRLGVFRDLVSLWNADRSAAEAVVLHEIAHARQKDHPVVGLGSPFADIVTRWAPVFLLVSFLPILFYGHLGGLAASSMFAQLLANLTTLPALLMAPVAALWLAEFGADRLAVQERGAEALRRALAWGSTTRPPSGLKGGLKRGLDLLAHPPARLRRAVAGAGEGAMAVLLLAWPAALLAQRALASIVAFPAFMLNGETPLQAAEHVARAVWRSFGADGLVFLGAAVLVLVWPLVIKPRTGGEPGVRWRPYLLAALLPLGLAVLGAFAPEQ